MSRLGDLFRNYVAGRVGGGQSPAVFWYLAEPPRVFDAASRDRYERDAHPSPLYLMDYRRKLDYRVTGVDGILAMNYGGGIGLQRNPEAAFQYALALHDDWRTTGDPASRDRFLHYATVHQGEQDREGRWAYRFDWYASRAPWYSGLAQARGASVMMRAWMVTTEERFRTAARAAIAGFDRPAADGGFVADHPRAHVPYVEEYPSQPTGVLNGFLASLFGLWELSHWLGDDQATGLYRRYRASAEAMLPHYTTRWWTLYDLDPESPFPNVHSPRYHRLATDYLRVLGAIDPSPAVLAFRDRWASMDHPLPRARAAGLKALKKILHR